MIVDKRFIEWFETADDRVQATMYNFVIFTLCSLSLKNRILTAIEILLGKRFCIYISRNKEKGSK